MVLDRLLELLAAIASWSWCSRLPRSSRAWASSIDVVDATTRSKTRSWHSLRCFLKIGDEIVQLLLNILDAKYLGDPIELLRLQDQLLDELATVRILWRYRLGFSWLLLIIFRFHLTLNFQMTIRIHHGLFEILCLFWFPVNFGGLFCSVLNFTVILLTQLEKLFPF